MVRILAVTLLIILSGCSPSERAQPVQKRKNLVQDGVLYREYLSGDLATAREALVKEAGLEKSEDLGLAPSDQALYISFAFTRLSALEDRAGNKSAAEVAMIKARYWALQHFELATNSEHGRPANEVISMCSPERLLEIVRKIDEGSTDGKGPRYLQDLEAKAR